MKRTLALVFATLLLVFTLTACGGNKKNDNNNAATDQNTTTDNGTTAPNEDPTPDNPIEGAGNAVEDTVEGAVQGAEDMVDGVENAADPAKSAARGTTTYGQMLRNGKVQDRDGFLNDGENAVTPGTV